MYTELTSVSRGRLTAESLVLGECGLLTCSMVGISFVDFENKRYESSVMQMAVFKGGGNMLCA